MLQAYDIIYTPEFALRIQVCPTVDGWNPKQSPGMYKTL